MLSSSITHIFVCFQFSLHKLVSRLYGFGALYSIWNTMYMNLYSGDWQMEGFIKIEVSKFKISTYIVSKIYLGLNRFSMLVLLCRPIHQSKTVNNTPAFVYQNIPDFARIVSSFQHPWIVIFCSRLRSNYGWPYRIDNNHIYSPNGEFPWQDFTLPKRFSVHYDIIIRNYHSLSNHYCYLHVFNVSLWTSRYRAYTISNK